MECLRHPDALSKFFEAALASCTCQNRGAISDHWQKPAGCGLNQQRSQDGGQDEQNDQSVEHSPGIPDERKGSLPFGADKNDRRAAQDVGRQHNWLATFTIATLAGEGDWLLAGFHRANRT
jgi:hypothetical protein